jgi:hypothetical protein
VKSRRGPLRAVLLALFVLGCLAVGLGLFYGSRPLPTRVTQDLREGVRYYRRFHTEPRWVVVHIVTVDLTAPGLHFLVTPGDPESELSLQARRTSQFVDEFGLLVAVNGDGYTPWYFNSLLDYYPRPGDPVAPNGLAASQGQVYGIRRGPVLFITSGNTAGFETPAEGIHNAISGDRMLVRGGQPLPNLPDDLPAPRTAVGVTRNRDRLILLVADGRQPLYSLGLTLAELADLLVFYGAGEAMNLDGGGSTTLVVRGPDGRPRVMNSPIDANLPGRERAVGNHLGFYFVDP